MRQAVRLGGLAALFGAAGLVLAQQAVVAPERVPFQYGKGKHNFERYCAECHGQWGGGSDKGPPLMHRYYEPSHHSDRAFALAIVRGTHQHHWNFGDMQPVPGMAQEDIGPVIRYVRWLQKQNGVY